MPDSPFPPGTILVRCLFLFPVPAGQDPAANDNQAVTTAPLDTAGLPVQSGGAAVLPTASGVSGQGSGAYSCPYACPPGFKGAVAATLTTGPNAGQTASWAIDLSAAVDLSDVSLSAGAPRASLVNPLAIRLLSGSDGAVYVPVAALGPDKTPATVTGNPVEIALCRTAPTDADFQTAGWVVVGSAVFARLFLSVLSGTALPPQSGPCPVWVRVNGLEILPPTGELLVQQG